MSGYIGNPDAESEHALILNENGLHAVRQLLVPGQVLTYCQDEDCGEEIPEGRRNFFLQRGQRCLYCVHCQPKHAASRASVKMLDRIL